MDQVRAWTEGIPMNTLYNLIRTQTTLTSLKELSDGCVFKEQSS